MAPTPLSVFYRVIFHYTVLSLQHKMQFYLDVSPSSDPLGFDTVPRPGQSATGLSTITDPWYTKMAPYYDPATSSFDGMELVHYNAGSWVHVVTNPTAVVPTGTPPNHQAWGTCFAGKDTINSNMPCYFYEMTGGAVQKLTNYATLGASNQAIVNALFNTGSSAGSVDPWVWRKGKGGAHPDRWLSLVQDSNEKLRRIRHIK